MGCCCIPAAPISSSLLLRLFRGNSPFKSWGCSYSATMQAVSSLFVLLAAFWTLTTWSLSWPQFLRSWGRALHEGHSLYPIYPVLTAYKPRCIYSVFALSSWWGLCWLVNRWQGILVQFFEGSFQLGPNGVYCGLHILLATPRCRINFFLADFNFSCRLFLAGLYHKMISITAWSVFMGVSILHRKIMNVVIIFQWRI
jgi:hypothetical protein